jgi:hypothetical protein
MDRGEQGRQGQAAAGQEGQAAAGQEGRAGGNTGKMGKLKNFFRNLAKLKTKRHEALNR